MELLTYAFDAVIRYLEYLNTTSGRIIALSLYRKYFNDELNHLVRILIACFFYFRDSLPKWLRGRLQRIIKLYLQITIYCNEFFTYMRLGNMMKQYAMKAICL